MAKTKILIVDDEADIIDLLEYNLEKEGFEVVSASNGEEAIQKLSKEKPDVILLDIMMPKMDGIEACRKMRELPAGKNAVIIFLTARSEEYSEIAGLEAGADDYISKPIKPRLLLSRIQAVSRRGSREDKKSEIVSVGDIQIFKDEFRVTVMQKDVHLAKKEFELLLFLAERPGKVFSREALLENVWGNDVLVVERTIDVHILKLREKVGKIHFDTIKGVGYKFNDQVPTDFVPLDQH